MSASLLTLRVTITYLRRRCSCSCVYLHVMLGFLRVAQAAPLAVLMAQTTARRRYSVAALHSGLTGRAGLQYSHLRVLCGDGGRVRPGRGPGLLLLWRRGVHARHQRPDQQLALHRPLGAAPQAPGAKTGQYIPHPSQAMVLCSECTSVVCLESTGPL